MRVYPREAWEPDLQRIAGKVEKATGKGYAKAAGTMVFNRFTGLGEEDIITGAYDIRESRSEEILEPGEGGEEENFGYWCRKTRGRKAGVHNR